MSAMRDTSAAGPPPPDPARLSQQDLARMRQEYAAVGLAEEMLPADPLSLFHQWLAAAVAAAIAEANAMVLATVDENGCPSSRTVLCKVADERGFGFYCNLRSRKAREIAGNPRVALLFPWHSLGRQIRVEGAAQPLPEAESDAYFASRPRGAQLSAWASAQSDVVTARADLEQRVAEVTAEFAGRDVPRPPHWGGLLVVPDAVEFWQGRADRLHDRLVYRRTDSSADWLVARLQP
jgi:pyridoxamine 5'-phosphate oxidase